MYTIFLLTKLAPQKVVYLTILQQKCCQHFTLNYITLLIIVVLGLVGIACRKQTHTYNFLYSYWFIRTHSTISQVIFRDTYQLLLLIYFWIANICTNLLHNHFAILRLKTMAPAQSFVGPVVQVLLTVPQLNKAKAAQNADSDLLIARGRPL